MNSERDFGIWLRQLRAAHDLTQEALAEAVACASQTVRAFESGRRRPSREMAARLADTLKVPPAECETFLRLARTPLAATAARATTATVAEATPATRVQRSSSLLPRPADGLIGRHGDQERLRQALVSDQERLVTLLGPGGIGKTRLALQTATNLADQFADVAFVALASVGNVAGVVAAIAVAVDCPLAGVSDSSVALLTFLRDRALLLVLDNIEHLLGPDQGDLLTTFLLAILREAPGVQLLLTSRERLRLRAEWVVEIGGLGLPLDDQPTSIAHSDAVLLFVERARRITGDFTLGPHNQLTVAQICRRLDGLPLALELAAAQVSFLPPTELLARLDQALPLLEGGPRDLPARQRAMRATIDWSHDLLPADERRMFQRLGVLVGSFSLAAAEAIGAGDEIAPTHVLGLLRRLVDRSLVVRDGGAGNQVRYRLLEPVRQYALEQLEAQPDQASAARRRHVAFFQMLAEQLGRQLGVPQDKAAFTQLLSSIEQEYPNIRAAVTWALAHEQAAAAAQIGWGLSIFWWYRGQQREPQGWMQAALAQRERLPAQVCARALLALAVTLYGATPSQSLEIGQAALALFEQSGDTHGQAHIQMYIGLAWLQDRDYAQAADMFQRAHSLSASIGDHWLAAEASSCLGLTWAYAGQLTRATVLLEQVLATARAQHDTWNESQALFQRALVAHAQGDVGQVAHYCRAWMAFSPDFVIVNGSAVAFALESVAVVAALQGEQERAARLVGAADALWEIAGKSPLMHNDTSYERTVNALRQELATPALAAAQAAGRAMSVTEAVAYALAG